MKNRRNCIILSIFINVVLLNIARSINMGMASVLAMSVYFVFTFYTFNQLGRENFWQNVLIIFLGVAIVHLPMRVIDFRSQLVSFPELACEIIGILLGYLFFAFGKTGKSVTLLLTIILSISVYLNYDKIHNSLNYSNLFYKNTQSINIEAVPYSDSNRIVLNETILSSDEYIVLNIWATTCGSCIAEFPVIDSLNKISSRTSNIQLFTACILQAQDRKKPHEIVKQKGCDFPVLTIPNWEVVKKEYGMDRVPVTFVIKDRKVLFRGRLLEAWDILQDQIGK